MIFLHLRPQLSYSYFARSICRSRSRRLCRDSRSHDPRNSKSPLPSALVKMSSEPVPVPSTPNTGLHTSSLSSDSTSSSIFDKIGTWASENKAIVYTLAGVAVVVSGAGAVYYLSDSRGTTGSASERKRPSKKERRKAKQEREKGQGQTESRSSDQESSRAATVESDPLEGIPQIDESSVENLSDDVCDVVESIRKAVLITQTGENRDCWEAEACRQQSIW